MPNKGLRGYQRSADLIGTAKYVTPAAPSEEKGAGKPVASAAAELGKLGGVARAKKLTAERRAEIARKAAAKRWYKS